MNGWQKTTLEAITDKIGDGLHGTPKYSIDGQYFFINGSNLQDGEIVTNVNTKRINHDEYTKIKKNLMNRTILVAINGTLGNVGIYKGEKIALGKSACYLNIKDEINLHFVRYEIEHTNFQQYAGQYATGATIKNLSLKAIRDFSFMLPPKEQQDFIESIISSYNTLIENNQKRIAILEEMAQRLYTEWFVKLKFPDHENVKMVDSGTEFGEIPEGWVIKELSDIGKVITGSTPSKQNSQYYGSDYKLIKTPDFNQGVFLISSEESLSKIGFEVLKTRLLPKHTVMVSTIGTLGKVAITTEESFTNQQINSLVLNNPNDYIYFYFFAKSLKRKLEGLGSNGATMGNVSKSKYESIALIYPLKSILEEYFKLSSSNFLEIETLVKKNKILVDMRDKLIENLVTGKRLLKNHGKTN